VKQDGKQVGISGISGGTYVYCGLWVHLLLRLQQHEMSMTL
jgi:hypothetical protein